MQSKDQSGPEDISEDDLDDASGGGLLEKATFPKVLQKVEIDSTSTLHFPSESISTNSRKT
ncbi:MAG: hypothetical protein AB8B85_20040 [Paracoccaceae bacterium]